MEDKYLTNGFLEMLYQAEMPGQNLLNCDIAAISDFLEDGKRRLRSILCLDRLEKLNQPIRESRQELEGGEVQDRSIEIEKYDLYAVKELVIPVYICRPIQGPEAGTVLYLHGHDETGAWGALWERTDKVRYHKNLPLLLARQGYRVIVPELLGFGESSYQFPGQPDKRGGCAWHCAWLNMAGLPLAGVRTYQVKRVFDWMEQRCPGEEVTVFGVSGGGQTAAYAAILDDRIRRVILSCYVGSYKESILKKEHCIDNYLPGMFSLGDCYEIISLMAPKPLCLINGRYDRIFQIEGTKQAIAYLEQVYKRLGRPSAFTGIITQGAHEISPDEVLWWLKGTNQ